jgi:prepilin-type processing-associated H-X9-DG protein
VLAAEKVTFKNDYYIEPNMADFDIAMAWYRHGLRRGANFLFFDGHVELLMKNQIKRGMDPWGEESDVVQ